MGICRDLASANDIMSEVASNLIAREGNSNAKQLKTDQPFPSGKLLPSHRHIPAAHKGHQNIVETEPNACQNLQHTILLHENEMPCTSASMRDHYSYEIEMQILRLYLHSLNLAKKQELLSDSGCAFERSQASVALGQAILSSHS